jgi:hypothetical protein
MVKHRDGFTCAAFVSIGAPCPIESYHAHRMGARGSVVVKALCYKMEGREFDTR